ncbi:uracil permease [Myroides marinus]|uniref:uracil permease n=1 Tax=Myroides marinus TaxID=703342 RepID=UPI000742185F|nr:uracil permease [Myroides marinus]KUF40327.1 uracil permease [Myroides marinus]MDM1347589.1 uracil permease [Myroides marinus]MDM1354384.1 uracil permease [Myroides marinus]MDM1379884.1 uracil permease [Myroides marinus]MDM1387167.1 uracil permease [Myroides marinus]
MSEIDDKKIVLAVDEKPKLGQWILLSIQHLFAMFGATVLVPTLTGMNPAIALISSGIGTLVFIFITKGKVPSYLGSSFAFINPIIALKLLEADSASGLPVGSFLVGSFLVGVVYSLVALLIAKAGTNWLMRLLPPIVVGPVIMVIGLGLASTAVGMVTNNPAGEYDLTYVSIGLVTLAITIITAIFTRGFLSVVPVLIGIIGGYCFAAIMGVVDFTKVIEANWIQVPDFMVPFVDYTPSVSWYVILLMLPVAIVPIAEHIGHQLVLSKVIDKDLIRDPGLHRSMLGDGVATMLASLIGGPPNTTYGENIGVLAITRAFSIYVFIGAACFAIVFGFCGKVAALLSTIPAPVMGGVSILLFGIIASSGLRMLVENNVDFKVKRNLIISSVILIIGIGGAAIHIGELFSLEGMALASIIGIVLNIVLPGRKDVDFDEMFKKS